MLENKIGSYQAILKAHDPNYNCEVDNLWNEGEEINQEGRRLLRINSKPGMLKIIQNFNFRINMQKMLKRVNILEK